MSEIPVSESRTVAEIRRAPLVVQDDVTFLFDTARFEQLQRLAGVMAACKTMPTHLKGSVSDCFRVASQAMRWQMDPFAICDKTYEVGGKLAYEGQLIAAVVNLRAGLEGRLSYRYAGDPATPDTLSIIVAGKFRGEAEERTIEATWKAGFAMSKGARDKWQSQPEQQLSYFGARVWARRHCPEIILGAYTPEELFDDQQQLAPKDVTPRTGDKLDALEASITLSGVPALERAAQVFPSNLPPSRPGDDAGGPVPSGTPALAEVAASRPGVGEDAFGLPPIGEQPNSPTGEPSSGQSHAPPPGEKGSVTIGPGGPSPSPAGEPDQDRGERRAENGTGAQGGVPAPFPGDLPGLTDENLIVPLVPRPTPAQLDYFARQMLRVIAEKPPAALRLATIRRVNETGLLVLKKGAVERYNEVQRALTGNG